MRGAEGIVDIDIAERGELPRERGVVGLLARVEAKVLEHAHIAGPQRIDHRLCAFAGHVRRETHRRMEKVAAGLTLSVQLLALGTIALLVARAYGDNKRFRSTAKQLLADL